MKPRLPIVGLDAHPTPDARRAAESRREMLIVSAGVTVSALLVILALVIAR